MDVTTIGAIVAGVLAILAVLIPGIISIIKELKQNTIITKDNTAITVAGQVAGAARGVVRDKRIQEIHILTNGRLTAALKLIMVMSKKEWTRTGTQEDKDIYDAAQLEVSKSEDAIVRVSAEDEDDESLIAARAAEKKLALLTNKVIEDNGIPPIPIVH